MRRSSRSPQPDRAPSSPVRLARSLLAWYERAARPLPWRETRDPYAIWVSEIMLQQTQVKTVIPYWQRWMRALPTVAALARAREDRILKLWEGLGYYRRARLMQQAARCIVEEHEGVFPDTPESVLALPGIGRYTAGAICSIAYNLPTPIVDGNVLRVLTRVIGIEGNPKARAVQDQLWDWAQRLVTAASRLPASRPGIPVRPAYLNTFGSCGNLNQALMELGALVCTPASPRCSECPLKGACFAYQHERQSSLPAQPPRATATTLQHAALVLTRGSNHFVRQRPEGVVNAGLWEFPTMELDRGRGVKEMAAAHGLDRRAVTRWMVVRHSITRYRITLTAYRGEPSGKAPAENGQGRWVTARQLARLPFTGAHRKLVEALLKEPK